jgi:hypothetical protein
MAAALCDPGYGSMSRPGCDDRLDFSSNVPAFVRSPVPSALDRCDIRALLLSLALPLVAHAQNIATLNTGGRNPFGPNVPVWDPV